MVPRRLLLPLAVMAAAALPASASAAVPHTVSAGETLTSVAAANGMSVGDIAAASGLPADAQLVAGTTVQIPAAWERGAAAPATTSAAEETAGTTATASGDGYLVQPGDTLSGVAAANGLSVASLAAANGLTPASFLLSGTRISLSGSAATAAPVTSEAAPAATTTSTASEAPAAPAGASVGSSDIAEVAARNGVDPSLAQAVAWQESGFDNGAVSSVGAQGVMQVMPGTWDWVQQNLALRPLDKATPTDNVGAGVLYLGHLLEQTGGDEATAIAGYYQGLGSVRSRGLYDDTQQYVANVQALRSRYGG